ncbi:MAG: hypothetical protein KGJ66_14460 [Alphaproteobacteria bacterium]|nr:hypothetical protein [Alphaproteobacteria bacterium]
MIVIAALAAPAWASEVTDIMNNAHYPARVNAVIWNFGRLDTGSPVKFGAWTVKFTQPSYVATYVQTGPYQIVEIGNRLKDGEIDPNSLMTCTNAVSGSYGCHLQLKHDLGGQVRDECDLIIHTGNNISDPIKYVIGSKIIVTVFPTALDLQE